MKYICDSANTSVSASSLSELQALCDRSTNFESLVYQWVNKERSVVFCPGDDDESDETLVCLIFKERNLEVASVYFPVKEVRQQFPRVEPVSSAEQTPTNEEEWFEDLCDEEWFERRDKKIEQEWNDQIGGPIVSKRDCIEVAVSYALSDIGEASFSMLDDDVMCDWLADEEVPAEFGNGLIFVGFSYHNSKNGRGWGESFFVLP